MLLGRVAGRKRFIHEQDTKPGRSMQDYRMHIGGEWVPAATGETFETANPFTGKPWALIPRGGAADANRAVEWRNELSRPGLGRRLLPPPGVICCGGLEILLRPMLSTLPALR